MKKLLIALMCMMMTLLVLPAWAEEGKQIEYVTADYTYILQEDGTAEIIKYNGEAKDLELPVEIDNYQVTAIGDGGFYGCSSLTSVTVPDSIVSMGINPFEMCTSLSSITVSPDHPILATIDGVLFNKKDKCLICYPSAAMRSNYTIPYGIEIIGDGAFSGSNMISISIPESVNTIGSGAFVGCKHLRSVEIPDSVNSIGAGAFYKCSNLIQVTLSNSVTSIDNNAFCFCESLNSVDIPNSVKTIGNGAFYNCSQLKNVVIPNSVISIGDDAFSFCDSLPSITIPDSVTSIGERAFFILNNLTLTVGRNSYAKAYCEEYGLNYTYPDANDWLNN